MVQPVGPCSAEVELSVGAPPADPPGRLRVTDSDLDTVTVKWDPPSAPNGVITAYTLDTDEMGAETFETHTVPPHTTSFTLRFLSPGTTHRVQVSAVNAAGEGPASPILVATTRQSALARFTPGGGDANADSEPRDPPPHRRDSIRGAPMRESNASSGRGASVDAAQASSLASLSLESVAAGTSGGRGRGGDGGGGGGGGGGEAGALAALRASYSVRPKGTWSAPQAPPAPAPRRLEPWERTNPDAVGRGAAARQKAAESMFARKRSEQEEEVDRRVQLAKEAARGHAATVAPPAVSQGIANDSPDLMADEMRRKREFWNDTLRRDRASRGSTRALVGEEDATRLLRPGGMLADPAGEARGLEDGVTSALVRLLIAASKGQLIGRRCNRRNRKSVRQCGIHVSS
jgi:hypothetical protein